MKQFVIFLVRIYRFFSPLFGPNCRYYPTCSQYAIESVREKGVIIGLFYSFKRILKCNPFGGYGYDPVKNNKKL